MKSGSAIGASEFTFCVRNIQIQNLANNNDSGNPYLETPHHVNTNWRTLFIKYSQVLIPMSNVVYVLFKVIIEKSCGEVSPMGQDTIENVS